MCGNPFPPGPDAYDRRVTAASYDVCAPWATEADVVQPCCPGGMDNAALAADAFLGASTILYNLSGRRWPGVCTDIIRPTASYRPGLGAWWAPDGLWPSAAMVAAGYAYSDVWGLWGFCSCNREEVCGCSTVPEIRLPGFPVVSVTTVKIDGVTVPNTEYVIQDRARLVRRSSSGLSWPCCQDVTLPTNQVGTWSVEYAWGAAPPVMGRRAAGVLGCELYKGWTGSGQCALPARVTNITRQGVTAATILDNLDVFKEGLTGLSAVDLWLSSLRVGASTGRGSNVVVPGQTTPSFRRDQP